MFAAERRNIITEILQSEKRVVVSELSKKFDVTEETIRRDLEKLEKDGIAVKNYGGAVLRENTNIDLPFNVRKKKNIEGKQKIAALAKSIIHDGQRIILDASTTAVFIAKAIKDKKDLTVITNSIEVLVELSDVENWTIISTGGSLIGKYMTLLGPSANDGIGSYYVDKAFFSCQGVDIENGVTDQNDLFTHAKTAMMRSAKDSVLVIDHSKFDVITFARICGSGDVDMVITDEKPEEKWISFFEEKGVELLYPEM